jgi:hypothetical protein
MQAPSGAGRGAQVAAGRRGPAPGGRLEERASTRADRDPEGRRRCLRHPLRQRWGVRCPARARSPRWPRSGGTTARTQDPARTPHVPRPAPGVPVARRAGTGTAEPPSPILPGRRTGAHPGGRVRALHPQRAGIDRGQDGRRRVRLGPTDRSGRRLRRGLGPRREPRPRRLLRRRARPRLRRSAGRRPGRRRRGLHRRGRLRGPPWRRPYGLRRVTARGRRRLTRTRPGLVAFRHPVAGRRHRARHTGSSRPRRGRRAGRTRPRRGLHHPTSARRSVRARSHGRRTRAGHGLGPARPGRALRHPTSTRRGFRTRSRSRRTRAGHGPGPARSGPALRHPTGSRRRRRGVGFGGPDGGRLGRGWRKVARRGPRRDGRLGVRGLAGPGGRALLRRRAGGVTRGAGGISPRAGGISPRAGGIGPRRSGAVLAGRPRPLRRHPHSHRGTAWA